MVRSSFCDETSLKKGPWTAEEDEKLVEYIKKHGHGSWRALPKLAGLNRCGKSCRLRWTNYLRPDIKRGKFSQDEEQTILHLHSILGNKWSAIASHLPGRADNEVKNFWNTNLKKRLLHMGFDPTTHRPRTNLFSSLSHLMALASFNKITDDNSLEKQAHRIQTEALQIANIQCLQSLLQTNPQFPTSISFDKETCNLLNSLASYEEPQLEMTQTLQGIGDSISFSHLLDLQEPCSFQTPSVHKYNLVQTGLGDQFTVLSQGDNYSSQDNVSCWIPQYVIPYPSVGAQVMPPSFINNLGDVSSNSTYGGEANSFLPELLLENPLSHHKVA